MKKAIYLAIIAPLVFASCTKEEDQTIAVEKVRQVQVEKAVIQSVEQNYEFSSTVDANAKNYITSAGGTRIEKIFVEVGDRVSKGQTLVTMENTQLLTTTAQLENLKVEVDRMKALYKSGGVSKQQLDQLLTQYDVAKESAENLAENITLTSPIDGIVTMRNFDNGDISAGQPILQVMQITPVKLKINVAESFYTRVKKGLKVNATTDLYKDEEFEGTISLVYPTIDPSTRTFTCEINIPNSNRKLRPGMFTRVSLEFGAEDRILVSDRAVIKQSGTNDRYVFIEKDGVLDYRQVALGRRLGNKYEVLSGVKDGENIVVSSPNGLLKGTKVEVVK